MGIGTSFQAIGKLLKPRLRDPLRNSKKFARVQDSIFSLTKPAEMDKYFSDFTGLAEQEGKRDLLLKKAEEFHKDIIKKLTTIENTEESLLYVVKNRIKEIHKQAKDIEKVLKDLKTKIPNGSEKVFEYVLDAVHLEWRQIFNVIGKMLENDEKLLLNIARNRSQFITYSFQTDTQIKRDIGFFYNRDRDIHKEESTIYDKLERHIKNLTNEKYIANVEKDIKQDLKELLQKITKEIELIYDELKDLDIFIMEIEKSLMQVFQSHVIKNLKESLGLDDTAINTMKSFFEEIFKQVGHNAEIDYEMAKKISMEAHA